MPYPKIPAYWREKVKGLLSQHDGRIGDRRILQILEDEADQLRDSPDAKMRALAGSYPALRSIGRIRSNEWVPMSSEEKAQYRDFSWPDSMERGDLPWEASAAVLELLGIQQVMDLFTQFVRANSEEPLTALDLPIGRPSVRLARWYWRVTQAAPDLPAPPPLDYKCPSRYRIARAFATCEAVGDVPEWLRVGVECYFSYAPWRSPTHAAHYSMAIASGQILELNQENLANLSIPLEPYPLEAIREGFGRAVAEHWGRVIHDHISRQQDNQDQEDTNGEAQG